MEESAPRGIGKADEFVHYMSRECINSKNEKLIWYDLGDSLTFKQSKNLSTIIQNLAVPAVSSGPKEFNTLPNVSFKTCAARFTLITE